MQGNQQKSQIQQSNKERESFHSDQSYEEPQEQLTSIPEKNAHSEAIFNKYQKQQQMKLSVAIMEQDNDCLAAAEKKCMKFIIKNLDTGEEQEIQTDQQEENMTRKLSEGRNNIDHYDSQWRDFWINVRKNNEKLCQYCQDGLYDQVNELIEKGSSNYPIQIDWKGLDQWSPLHYACYVGYDDIVELLCSKGANVNSVTRLNRNGLHIASLRGHIKVVKSLVKFNIQINSYDYDGNTALHFAAQNGYKQIIEYLLQIGSKIRVNREGVTPIHDCHDQSLRKVFYKFGFKQNDNYEENGGHEYKKINKLQKNIISQQNLTPQSFIFHKRLGKGSFGEVFLVHKKDDPSRKLHAIKVLSKQTIEGKNLRKYAMTERNVLSALNHPFMVKLVYAFQSQSKLFLVMQYYPGGDLGKLVMKKKKIPESQAKKYISQLILALQALHKNMIIFRDLKPDNVVLDSEGHCRLTDFGLSKQGIYNNKTKSFCGSVAYLAPQILAKQGHSRTIDWYLLGLLLYQLIVGFPPYYNTNREILFQNIRRGPLRTPSTMSSQAKDIIKKLLCRDQNKRLGAYRDAQQLKQHPFFENLNWNQVLNRKLIMPPIQEPKINYNQTISVNFNEGQVGKKLEGWTFINN